METRTNGPRRRNGAGNYLGGRLVRRCSICFFAVVAMLFGSPALQAQDSPEFFALNCKTCHTIGGGRLTGPDLKNVSERKNRAWLIGFMMDPKAVLASGDAYAAQILAESRNVPMPNLPGMTRQRAEDLLNLIDAESKLEKSQFKGVQVSTKPFTKEDRDLGMAIFIGTSSLKEKGSACISCHAIRGLSALGGGKLGPDLTHVYEKYKDRATLSAWLSAPATETMLPIFKNHPLQEEEIHALVALFEGKASHSGKEGTAQPDASSGVNQVAFLLMGLLSATALVFMFDAVWKQRFRAVRRPMIESTPQRGLK